MEGINHEIGLAQMLRGDSGHVSGEEKASVPITEEKRVNEHHENV